MIGVLGLQNGGVRLPRRSIALASSPFRFRSQRVAVGNRAKSFELPVWATDVELLEASPVIGSQSIDLRLGQFRGDDPHSPIDIVAALARGIHLQLQSNVFLHLLSKNWRLDRTA